MKLVPKHALATRIYHWINVPVLFVMIWSGMLIYWAHGAYEIRLGSWGFPLFPEWFYEALEAIGIKLRRRLAIGMEWHFTVMWLFAINGILYVGYTLISGHWKELVPTPGSFVRAWHVVLHDLGLRKQPLPRQKYNDAQKFAYTGVVLMGLGSLLTGLAIYKPVQLGSLTAMMGGYQSARYIHFVLTMGYLLFFVIHIAQVIRAGWNNFRSMVIGVELVSEESIQPQQSQPASLPVAAAGGAAKPSNEEEIR